MKMTNKKLLSSLLAFVTVFSLGHVKAQAASNEVITEAQAENYLNENVLEKEYDMNGLYNVMVGTKPVYVYLGNEVRNEYLPKMEALVLGDLSYDKTYLYSKTVDNPNYIPGVSSFYEKTVTVYALSDKSRVEGWTRINRDMLGANDKVATSIELGEFILTGTDLSSYRYNMLGFANADINKDGVSNELMYLGNNKVNQLMTKEEAIIFGVYNYENYYIQSKSVPNPDYNYGVNPRTIKVYALSEKSYVSGWTKVNKTSLPNDALVASNVEYMDALVHVRANEAREVINNTPVLPVDPIVPDLGYTYNQLGKDAAIEYAYNNPQLYSQFCIRFKVIYNPIIQADEMLFTLDTTNTIDYVDNNGWSIIGNDYIPSSASLFLTMGDAQNYEFMVKNNITRTLQP